MHALLADRYELGDLLGQGGAGRVYRGFDRVLARPVAVKVIDEAARPDAHRAAEARILASLNHTALVTIHDVVTTGPETALVMELLDGGTLRDRIASGPMPPEDVRAVALRLAEALAFVHARGVVHRDVKPGNVLFARGSSAPKLTDFGIARMLDATGSRTTGVLGTAQYLSPEQARGERVGPASDIYSLGLTLLEALTGEPAFPGTAAETLVARLLRDPLIPGELGGPWRGLLTTMTGRDPSSRLSAQDVVDRIRHLQHEDEDEDVATAALDIVPVALAASVLVESGAVATTATMPVAGPVRTAAGSAGRPVRRRRRLALGGAALAAATGAAIALAAATAAPPEPIAAPAATSTVDASTSGTPRATSTAGPTTAAAPATASTNAPTGITTVATTSTKAGTAAGDSDGTATARNVAAPSDRQQHGAAAAANGHGSASGHGPANGHGSANGHGGGHAQHGH